MDHFCHIWSFLLTTLSFMNFLTERTFPVRLNFIFIRWRMESCP